MDRNLASRLIRLRLLKSLSARRAWIEIEFTVYLDEDYVVALRKESVDRNRG